jgi:hypothetical protein
MPGVPKRRDHLQDHRRPADLRVLRNVIRTSAARRLAAVAHAALLLSGLHGCARERVEIAETRPDGGESAVPMFPIVDAGPPTCGPAPVVTVCDECPNGFVWVDGSATCECCP